MTKGCYQSESHFLKRSKVKIIINDVQVGGCWIFTGFTITIKFCLLNGVVTYNLIKDTREPNTLHEMNIGLG